MKYMGSKAKYAKYILPIILKDRKPEQYYVEPFVGGCNMIDKVSGLRIGVDLNRYLISMWDGLQRGLPKPAVNKETYVAARHEYNSGNVHLSDFEIGYIGWMGSFNGRFFDGGFSGITDTRDYISEQIRNTEKQISLLKGVEFSFGNYFTKKYPVNSIIYCDPPYQGTKQYATSKAFDYAFFWEWCREQKEIGHQIFISEYAAPPDFTCVWEKEVTNSMNPTKTYKPVEKLFTYDNCY